VRLRDKTLDSTAAVAWITKLALIGRSSRSLTSKFALRDSAYDARTVNRTLKRWAKETGLQKNISFHVGRHTFGTLCISSGLDIYTTSKLLGHSKVTTTQVYAQLTDTKKTEAVAMLPDIGMN